MTRESARGVTARFTHVGTWRQSGAFVGRTEDVQRCASCYESIDAETIALALKSARLINTWLLTLKGSSQFQPVMDGLVGQGGGADVQSEASSGTAIHGLLPETSAGRLSVTAGTGAADVAMMG